ncbi:MAG: hypothetical protein U0Y96_14095 [Candidatus Kapaibacterium sp.]
MNRFYARIVALLSIMLLSTVLMVAQTDYQIGTGTTAVGDGTTPWMRFWSVWRIQYVWTAAELNAAGMAPGQITAIQFNCVSPAGDAAQQFTIKIGATAQTAATTTFIASGLNTVYGPVTEPVPAAGWNKYNFSTPFLWDGSSNLVVDVCSVYPASSCVGWTSSSSVQASAVSNVTTYYYTDGNCSACTQATGNMSSYRPNVKFTVLSGIEASFPEDKDPRRILSTYLYDGSSSSLPKPSLTFRKTATQVVTLNYKIVGPLPSTNVVYQALNSASTTDTNIVGNGNGLVTQTFDYATGALAGANGALDARNAVGGAYRVDAVYKLSTGYTQNWSKQFIIAFANDISLADIVVPTKSPYKYLRGVDIPMIVRVQNVGLNPATNWQVVGTITTLGGSLVRRDTFTYNNTTGLATGDYYNVQFPNYNTLNVGSYCFSATVTLQNGQDQNVANNTLPTGGGCWQFDVQYDTELSADAIVYPTPGSNLYVNRPIEFQARFKNNGATDQSDVLTTLTIYKWDGANYVQVFTVDKVLPDIAFTPPAVSILKYSLWTPTTTGLYRVCISINAVGDPVSANNLLCQDFNVTDGFSGTYTIGTINAGQSRNFNTIQEAVDALYSRGITGPVVFELTDGSYTVGNGCTLPNSPALDFSAKILGVSSVNTITFKPALLKSLSRASIGIRLQSSNGVGIYFGQNVSPGNPNAVQNQFKNPQLYANPAGYVTFDGGDQRSFRFMLDVCSATPTTLPHRSVFYLGLGTSNITIKNCLIENYPQSTASYAANLPIAKYISPNFSFEDDTRSLTSGLDSYSAGIVSRSKVPSIGGNNALALDTLSNDNNKFISNEISGFGYGIVSLGVGPLFYNDIAPNGNPRFQRYYNKGTVISKNLISNVRRAGVYSGYGENEQISDNRIINVGIGATGAGGSTAGVMLGGAARSGQYVYNNIGSKVERNEISHVSSDEAVTGVLVEQTMNNFVAPTGGTVTFPNTNEMIRVTGNMIYSLSRTTQTATAAGVHLTTTRNLSLTGLNKLITPASGTYFTRGDSVVNNTVLMNVDNVTSGASVVGIGVQQATNTVLLNNAIAVPGPETSVNIAAGNTFAGIFYQGYSPKTSGGMSSNRNAFWTPSAAMVRFIEVDNASQILELGSQGDYTALGQWKAWTGQDINSVVGNFMNDYVTITTTTPNKMRIMSNPYPLGSLLDRRGERTGSGFVDLDGDPRGLNGSRFTIGADEFVGRLYVNDVEAIEVLSPVAYRSGTGLFSDAEYIMTKAPINVQARMRNNGSALQSGLTIMAEIWQDNGFGQFTSLVATNSKQVSIQSGESVDLNFDFNFTPQTYFSAASAPAQFAAMWNNVTPRYQVRVYTTTDENNTNNIVTKEVRFYLQKSPIRMLTSTVGATMDKTSPTITSNDLIGRLNHDALVQGFAYLNLAANSYDVFDRNGWEPRAVNYGLYRTMFWADDTLRLARQQRQDIRAYLATGTSQEKKNFVVASQEILGKHIGLDALNDEQFVRYALRATRSTQASSPRAAGYHNYNVIGQNLARGIQEVIQSTTHATDQSVAPRPSLMKIYSDAQTSGLALTAYSYLTRDAGVTDSIMGVATNALYTNVVFLGVDWRHFPRPSVNTGSERILRSVVEFIERNNGIVVPVELTEFDAKRAGEQVNITWETASEKNVSHFDVERAESTEKGTGMFRTVATVAPHGGSAVAQYQTSDVNVRRSQSYVYRLNMVDLDGSRKYSNEVLVAGEVANNAINITNNTGAEVKAVVTLQNAGATTVTLVDLNGRTVRELMNGDYAAQAYDVVIDARELSSGTYTIVVKQGAAISSQTVQIVK